MPNAIVRVRFFFLDPIQALFHFFIDFSREEREKVQEHRQQLRKECEKIQKNVKQCQKMRQKTSKSDKMRQKAPKIRNKR